jgi:hypothetical protein
MKMKKVIVLFFCIAVFAFGASGITYALGDGSSSSPDLPLSPGLLDFQKETGGSLVATLGIEGVIKRPLKNGDSSVAIKLDGGQGLLGIGYRMYNRVQPYFLIGVSDMDIDWTQYGSKIEADGDPNLVFGGGIKLLMYRTKLTSLADLKLNLDGQMRYTSTTFDTVKIAGTTRSVSAEEFKIFEGRIAATVGFQISLKKVAEFDDEDLYEEDQPQGEPAYLVPYAGLVFVDSEVRAEFDDGMGTFYSIGKADDKDNLHMIAGLDLIAPQYAAFNVEAQLFNGESVSGGVTIKF